MKRILWGLTILSLSACVGGGGGGGGGGGSTSQSDNDSGSGSGSGSSSAIKYEHLIIVTGDANTGLEPATISGSNLVILKDINPGAGNSSPTQFTHYQDKVFFSAANVDGDRDLYITKKTEASTDSFLSVYDGQAGNHTLRNISFSASMFGVPAYWGDRKHIDPSSDENNTDTNDLYTFSPMYSDSYDFFNGMITTSDYRMYQGSAFTAYRDLTSTIGFADNDLIIKKGSDGVGSGVYIELDKAAKNNANVWLVGGKLFYIGGASFSIGSGGTGEELYVASLSTGEGAIVEDFNANGNDSSGIANVLAIGNRLYMTANDGTDDFIISTSGGAFKKHTELDAVTMNSAPFEYDGKYCFVGTAVSAQDVFCVSEQEENSADPSKTTYSALDGLVLVGEYNGSKLFYGENGTTCAYYRISGSSLAVDGSFSANCSDVVSQGMLGDDLYVRNADGETLIHSLGSTSMIQDPAGNGITNITGSVSHKGKLYILGEDLNGDLSLWAQDQGHVFSEVALGTLSKPLATGSHFILLKD